MRRPGRLAAAAFLLMVALGNVGRAQAPDEPPASLPSGASFTAGTVSFTAGTVSFTAGSVSFSAGSVGFAAGRVSFSSGTVAASNAPVSAGGSPVTQGMQVKEERGGGLRFTLNADLLFDFDKASLRPAADEVLRALVAQVESRVPNGRFRVEGHTDGKGTDRYNDGLSLRRAKSVEAWLTRNARVAAKRISTTGLGKRRPVAPNEKQDGSDDPEGRQKNRRVEIVVLPP